MTTLRQTGAVDHAVNPAFANRDAVNPAPASFNSEVPESGPLAVEQNSAEQTVENPTGESERSVVESFLGFTRGDQWFLGLVCSVGLLAVVVYTLRLNRWGMGSVEMIRPAGAEYQYRVDINRATWVEWAQLEGLGATLGKEIVADREAHGPFRSVDELIRVKGIGPTNLERFRPWLTCSSADSGADQPSQGERSQ